MEVFLPKIYKISSIPGPLDELINIQDSNDAGKIIKGVISECIKEY